jgi:hypothetical protein
MLSKPKRYYNYLTNWGNTMVALKFIILTVGHCLQGHYSKNRVARKSKRCAALYWKFSVIAYENCVTVIFIITVGFWTIVFPYMAFGSPWQDPSPAAVFAREKLYEQIAEMKANGTFTSNSTIAEGAATGEQASSVLAMIKYWAPLSAGHTLPFIAVNVDVSMSAIMFYPNHVWITLTTSVLYLCYHMFKVFVINGPYVAPIYPSLDWYQEPILSSIYTAIMFGYLLFAFGLYLWISRKKIMRKYSGG